jgi:uncharacterized protein DUF4288
VSGVTVSRAGNGRRLTVFEKRRQLYRVPRNKLFVAVLVLQSRVANREEDLIVDHQVRIIRAPSGKEAYTRAMSLGKAENANIKDQAGETVTWEFLGLSELSDLDERQLQNGGELFSWRTRGPGTEFVRKQEELAVFAERFT